MSLWINIAFIVVETDATPAEVLAALPVHAEIVEQAPRRYALRETIHFGSGEANLTDLALFQVGRHTVIAPPGSVFLRTGELDWPIALSQRFARCWAFSTCDGASTIVYLEDGEVTVQVREDEDSEPGVLGVTTLVYDDDATVLGALGRLLGTDDVKALLRRDSCWLCRADSSR